MSEIEKAIAEIIETNYGECQCHRETMTTALSALREKAEREKGCDFCLDPDGDNSDNSIYIDHTDRAAITTHDVYVPISFCPMCGKPLKDGAK